MPTGVGPLDAIFQVGRGVAAMPEGIRQEGATGAFRSFLNPRPYEQTSRARGHREDAASELQQIEQIAQQAQTIPDIAPAFGMIQKLRGELEATGADEATLEKTLAPTFRQVWARAAQMIDTGDESAPLKLSQLATVSGNAEAADQAQSLQQIMTSRKAGEAQGATTDYRRQQATTEEQLRQPRVEAMNALAAMRDRGPGGAAGLDPTQPTQATLTGLRRDVMKLGKPDDVTGLYPDEFPDPTLLADYNDARDAMRMPALEWIPRKGLRDEGYTEDMGAARASQGQRTHQPYSQFLASRGGGGPATGQPAPQPSPTDQGTAFAAGPGPASPIPLEEQAPQAAPTPGPQRIQIPDVFRKRAASPNPQDAVRSSELLAYFRQQGLPEAQAREAARAAVQELAGGAGR